MSNKVCIALSNLLLKDASGVDFWVAKGEQVILTEAQYRDVSAYVKLVEETQSAPTVSPPVYSDDETNIDEKVSIYQPKSLKLNLIAHRGFVNHFPENTMLAMYKAMDNGADELECDVQLTADNIPVLFHDTTLDRLIDNIPEGKNTIRQLTLREVKALRFKALKNSVFADEPIPELGTFLQYAKSKGVVVYPEIKPGLKPAETTPIIQAVINAGMEHLTVFQSFDMASLKKVRELTQTAAVGFLTGTANVDALLTELAGMGRAYLLMQYNTILSNPTIVQKCKDKGVNLGVWTCNHQNDAIKLMSLGVTNIMSDIDLKGIAND